MEITLKQSSVIANNTLELIFEKPMGFEYVPGQYVFLQVFDAHGDMHMRAMSIAAHPSETILRFSMRQSDSDFKQTCNDIKVGGKASIVGPKGSFSLADNNKPIVFLVGGIGITPVLSMLLELEQQKFSKSVHLIYSNKTEDDVAYMSELENIDLPNFKMILKFTKSGERVNKDRLVLELEDLTKFQYYIVGSNAFTESMKEIVRESGVVSDNILIDNFGT